MANSAPRRIAERYELHEIIGQGGMGSVYRGFDTQTGQSVAIKHLKPELATPDLIERFRREGEALRELNHPNIVKMLDAVLDGEAHYLMMELIEGGSLRDTLNDHAEVPLSQLLLVALDLCDALTRSHRLDIIHRDIKPANVLIANDGTARLTDFGVARSRGSNLTDSDVIVGTFEYLSPELLRNEPASTLSDIWALGVMFFEMLAGEAPFQGEQTAALMTAILSQPVPDLEAMRPEAPVALVDLIYRMLAKNPAERIPSVRLVGAELEAIMQGRSPAAATDAAPAGQAQPADEATHIMGDRFAAPLSLTLHRHHNLPTQITPFVGREDELKVIAEHIAHPVQRLITIIAPGGMGKTRLSLAVAEAQLDRFADGVFFVELAPVQDELGMISAIADATGYPISGDPKPDLLRFLSNKNMLLVLDNFEHLTEDAALVLDILKAAPDVQILTTTRSRLEVEGETLFHLSGMDFPDWETPEDALSYATVQLFMQSAKRVRPAFELTTDNMDYVARICRLVGGMPLGIVLAAAWLGMLSVEEIAKEIQEDADFLQTDGAALPDRQRSIRTVFESAWNMMPEAEQHVFMQLSMFRGGFTRDAAQAITDASLMTLMSLVNKSLIRRDVETGRYSIHELLRQYAYEHLESLPDLYQNLRSAYASYYLGMLADNTDAILGSRQVEAATQILADFDNVRAAWLLATNEGWFDPLEAAFITLGQIRIWWQPATEVQKFWEPVYRACDEQAESHRFCIIASIVAASVAKDESTLLGIANEPAHSEDPLLQMLCYLELGWLAWEKGDYESALRFNQQALQQARIEGSPFWICDLMSNVAAWEGVLFGWSAYVQGGREAYDIANQHGNIIGKLMPLEGLQVYAGLYEGNYPQALVYAEERYHTCLRLQRTNELPNSQIFLSFQHLLLGNWAEAETWRSVAEVEVRIFNHERGNGLFSGLQAYFFCIEERYEEAKDAAAQGIKMLPGIIDLVDPDIPSAYALAGLRDPALALTIVQTFQSIRVSNQEEEAFATLFLPPIAHVAVSEGRNIEAVEMCAIAMHHPRAPQGFFKILPLLQNLIEDLKQTLSADEFNAAWERGKTMEYAPIIRQFLDEHGT